MDDDLESMCLPLFASMRRAFDGDPVASAHLEAASATGPDVQRATALLARAVIAAADRDPVVDADTLTAEALAICDDEWSRALGLRAAAHAVRSTALIPDRLDRGVSELVHAQALVRDDPTTVVEAAYAQLALNSITVFCIRVGLVDAAVEAAGRAARIEERWRGTPARDHEGGSGLLNVALMALQAGLAPLAEHRPVLHAELLRAGEVASTLAGDDRVAGREELLDVIRAVVEAFTGSADRTWVLLHPGGEPWRSARMPSTALWVVAAARATERMLTDAEVGGRPLSLESALTTSRDGFQHLVAGAGAESRHTSYLTIAACAQMLRTEQRARAAGHPDRAQDVLAVHDRLLSAMVRTSRRATAAVVAGQVRTHQLAERNSSLDRATRVDQMTRTNNRNHLEHVLGTWPDGGGLGIIIVDLDRFKAVNDLHGHLTGDEVLRTVAALLSSVTRGADSLFRYGGDEFVALLGDVGEAAATECATRMRDVVAGHDWGSLRPDLRVTISTGVAAGTHPPRQLLDRADSELLRQKRSRS